MIRYIFGFGWPILIGSSLAYGLGQLLPVAVHPAALIFFGLSFTALAFAFINCLFADEIWKLWHPKPNLPEYSIFRYWGSTAPLEYRIERLISVDVRSDGGLFSPKRWVARYNAIYDTELNAQAPWTKAEAVNRFLDEESAAAALVKMIGLKEKAAAELAAKTKPSPVAAYNASMQRVERWDKDVDYVS